MHLLLNSSIADSLSAVNRVSAFGSRHYLLSLGHWALARWLPCVWGFARRWQAVGCRRAAPLPGVRVGC
jgi:hypothetical protein